MKHATIMLLFAVCTATPAFSLLPNAPRNELAPYTTDTNYFPKLIRLIDEADIGSRDMEKLFILAYRFDGLNTVGQGDTALLASVRRTMYRLLDHEKRYEDSTLIHGIMYFAQKGDARDFPFFDEHLADPELQKFDPPLPPKRLFFPYRVLQHRVAGTNIVAGILDEGARPNYYGFLEEEYSANRLRFIPSVANTGPQAVYVYTALEQAVSLAKSPGYDSAYAIITNTAPELLTMRVWFDADGKAVCDVDLAKYGIFVPGLSTATNAPPPLESPLAASSARSCPVSFAVVVAGVLITLFLLAVLRLKQKMEKREQ